MLRQPETVLILRAALPICLALAAACGTPSPDGPDGDAGSAIEDEVVVTGACQDGPGEVFEQRIRPLIENDRPSSCSKCHAKGVDLAAFVRGDACESMACMVSQDLVTLEAPAESPILEFISRGYGADGEGGVTDDMVREEYKGFLAWIQWSAQCMEVACPGGSSCGARPPTPLEDVGLDAGTSDGGDELPPLSVAAYPCDEHRQIQAFVDHVSPDTPRCGHCHAPDGVIAGIADAPLWLDDDHDYESAVTTIRNLYALGNINLDEPRKSRVLLKPLHQDYGGIEHGGGAKFAGPDDPLYQALLAWIRMQRECRVSTSYPQTGTFDDEGKH